MEIIIPYAHQGADKDCVGVVPRTVIAYNCRRENY